MLLADRPEQQVKEHHGSGLAATSSCESHTYVEYRRLSLHPEHGKELWCKVVSKHPFCQGSFSVMQPAVSCTQRQQEGEQGVETPRCHSEAGSAAREDLMRGYVWGLVLRQYLQ